MTAYPISRASARSLLTWVVFFCWSASAAVAQLPGASEAAPVTFRMLSLDAPVSGLYYDLRGKPVAIYTDSSALSVIYQRPDTGKLIIYRQLPPEAPGKEPRRIPVASALMGAEGPYLVLLTPAGAASNEAGATGSFDIQVLDDSWTVHPAQNFRVINTSKRTIAIQLCNKNLVMQPGQNQLFPSLGKESMVDFKAATLEGETWVLRVISPQATIPRTRSTLLISDIQPTKENPNPDDITILNIFDSSPPPPPPRS